MARNKKISNWSKANKTLLMEMLDKGYIGLTDLQKINNKDGDFSIEAQSAAFKKVSDDINKRYSEARLDSAQDKKILSLDRIKEFTNLRKSVEAFAKKSNMLSEKLIDQIDESGIEGNDILEGLKSSIKDISSDQELKEYLFDIRGYLDRALSDEDIKAIPDLANYIDKKPKYGVYDSDFDKMFDEKNILDKFNSLNDLSYRRIKNIAEQNGMTGEELLEKMRIAKTAKDREAIAHGRWNTDASIPENIVNEIGGTLLTLFGRRQQEAIERGEAPGLKDIAGDVGEQVAYMVPLGRIAGPVGKAVSRIPKIGKSASKKASTAFNFGSNAIVPTASELYDAIAYDDDNPRGEFSMLDAGVGSTVNFVAPYAIRRAGSTIGRVADSKKIQRGWAELAEGKTVDDIIKKYKGVKIEDATNPKVSNAVRERAKELKSIIEADPEIGIIYQQKNPIVGDIAKAPGKNLEEKAKRYVNREYPKGYTLLDVDASVNAPTVSELYKDITNAGMSGNPVLESAGKWGEHSPELILVPELLTEYKANPNVLSDRLRNVYEKLGLDAAKSSRELLTEDVWKNYLTNQFGNFVYADGNVSIPGLNLLPDTFDINRLLKEHAEKKERDKKEKISQDRTRVRLEKNPSFERLLRGYFKDGSYE